MLQQLKQVGMTYWTRPRTWWGVAIYLGFLGLAISFLSIDKPSDEGEPIGYDILFICFYGALLPAQFLVEHTRWQFNHSRARLVPNFNRAHLLLTALTLLVLLIILPALLSISSGRVILPLMALAALTVSICTASSSAPFYLLFASVIFHKTVGLPWLLSSSVASNRALLLLLFLSWAAIGYWLYRLGYRHEEQAVYDGHTYADSENNTRPFRLATARKQSKENTQGRFKSWQLDRRIDRTLTYADTPPKWRLLCLGNRPIPNFSLRVLVGLVCWAGYMLFVSYEEDISTAGIKVAEFLHTLTPIPWVLTFLGAAFFGMKLAERLPYMTSESLLPLSKKQYLNDLLKGLAAYGLGQWIIFHLIIAVLLHIPFSAEHSPPHDHHLPCLQLDLTGLRGIYFLFCHAALLHVARTWWCDRGCRGVRRHHRGGLWFLAEHARRGRGHGVSCVGYRFDGGVVVSYCKRSKVMVGPGARRRK